MLTQLSSKMHVRTRKATYWQNSSCTDLDQDKSEHVIPDHLCRDHTSRHRHEHYTDPHLFNIASLLYSLLALCLHVSWSMEHWL